MSLTLLTGAAGVAAFVSAAVPGAHHAQFECVRLDTPASARVAALVSDDSADADIRLDEAIVQLRLARKHCRAGSEEIARANYQALDRLTPTAMAVPFQGD